MPNFFVDPATGNVMYGLPGGQARPIAGPPGLGIQDPFAEEFGLEGAQPLFAPKLTPEGRIIPTAAQTQAAGEIPPPEIGGAEAVPLGGDVTIPAIPGLIPAPITAPAVAGAPALPTPEAVPEEPAVAPVTEEEAQARIAAGEVPARTARESFALGEAERLETERRRREAQEEADVAARRVAERERVGAEEVADIGAERARIIEKQEARLVEQNRVRYAQHQQDIDAMRQSVDELERMTIDPGRMWKNTDTGRKISVGIGAVAQGFLNLRGFGQGNPVLAATERAIQRDIDAQKATVAIKGKAVTQRGNLLRLGLDVSADEREGEKLAMSVGLAQTAKQVEAAKARTKSETGKDNLEIYRQQLTMRSDQLKNEALDARNQRYQQAEMHELNKAKAETDIMVRRSMLAMKQREALRRPGRPGVQLPPESALRQARDKYGKGVKPETLVVSKFIGGPGWFVAHDRASAKEIRVDLDTYSDALGRMDQAVALIEREGSDIMIPGSPERLEFERLLQGMIIYGRPKGSGPQTERDATRLEAVFGVKAGRIWTMTSPEEAADLLRSNYRDTEQSINSRIDTRDIHRSGVGWQKLPVEEIAARGAGIEPTPVERARAVAEAAKTPEEMDVGPAKTGAEQKRVRFRKVREQTKQWRQTYSNKEIKKHKKGLSRDPDSSEYQAAIRYFEVLDDVYRDMNVGTRERRQSKDLVDKEWLRGFDQVRNAWQEMEKEVRQVRALTPEAIEEERRREEELRSRQQRLGGQVIYTAPPEPPPYTPPTFTPPTR